MKLTVIGHWGGYPKAGEATSGYLLQQEGFNLLVDCGSAVVSNLQKYIALDELNGAIISHYHHDHVADIGILQYGRLIKSRVNKLPELPVYGCKESNRDFDRLTMEGITRGIPYDVYGILNTGPFKISFLEMRHPVKCYGMRISCQGKTIVYTADTSYFDGLTEFSKDADLLICECNLYKDQNGAALGHLNSTEAANIAKNANVGHLLLTHLPQTGDVSELLKDAKANFSGRVDLAAAGWNVEL